MALWLFWRAHVDLGLNWSITLEIRQDHELIVHNIYRRSRHPMYATIFLFALEVVIQDGFGNLPAARADVFLKSRVAQETNHGAIQCVIESLLIILRGTGVAVVLG